MANYVNVTVKKENDKEVMKRLKVRYRDSSSINLIIGDLNIRSRGYNIIKDLEILSNELKTVINTIETFESEQYAYTYTIQYQEGKRVKKDLELNYAISCIKYPKEYAQKDISEIKGKLVKGLSKHDRIIKIRDGFKADIDYNQEFTYEYQRDDGYKFKGIKKGNIIDIVVYKFKYNKNTWEEIDSKLSIENLENLI